MSSYLHVGFFVDNEQNVDPRLLFKWKRLLPGKFIGVNDVQDEQIEKIVLQNQVTELLRFLEQTRMLLLSEK